jgi:undecaprenyl-diphosphatase
LDTLHAILVAILQGATELFPVSSLGHAVVLPALFGWNLDQKSASFLPFLVLLHTGTAAALLAYFWRDWWAIFRGVLGLASAHEVREARRVFVLIVVATIPAVILGFVFNRFFRDLFGNPMIVAGILVLNGLMLLISERIKGRGTRPLAALTPMDALVIGCWQCGALFPGISRSGATIVGGVLRGVDHEGSAHFSFLIALPIIVGATVLEVPHLLHASVAPGVLQTALLAAVVAGLVAYASTWFLMRYFRDHAAWALNPFGYYCVAFGLCALLWLGVA